MRPKLEMLLGRVESPARTFSSVRDPGLQGDPYEYEFIDSVQDQ
jgi:hypothetical protein